VYVLPFKQYDTPNINKKTKTGLSTNPFSRTVSPARETST
jgi:hypothetical protein